MDAVTKRIIDTVVAAVLYDYSHFGLEIGYEEMETGLTFELFGDGIRSAAHQLIARLKTNGITATVYYNNLLILNETQRRATDE
jgi:hypothetical protein